MIKDLNITSVNADKSKESVEKLGAAVDKTAASLKKLNDDVKNVNTSLNNSSNSFKQLEGVVNTFNNALNQSGITVGQVRSQMASLDSSLTQINRSSLNAGISSKDLGNSYKGMTVSLNDTSQSLLSTSNGFKSASEVSGVLGGSLMTVGTAGMTAGASMTNASSGTGLYAAAATGAAGTTLTLEQGVTRLVEIMSSEADVTKKVNDQLQINKTLLQHQIDGGEDARKSLKKYLDEEKAKLTTLQEGTKEYEDQIRVTHQIAEEHNKLVVKNKTLDSQLKATNRSINAFNEGLNSSSNELVNHTNSINQNTESLNRNGREGERNISFLSRMGRIMGNVGVYFTFTKILQSLWNTIKKGISTIKDFSKEVSKLSAITGLPKASEEMKLLESQAIALGKATEYTSKQIVELQVELAKLGLKGKDILASTNAISAGATAMGASLADAAKLGATTMKAYGLQANEMEQIMGALSKSTTKSALSFEYLTTALPYASTAASALGFELEDTLALLSSLADSGFKASQAGTGLRNIFSKLADETKKLGKELGPIRNMDDLLNAFENLANAGVDLGKAFELTDARAMNQFLTLVKNRKAVKELADEYRNTAGVLDEMREKQLDNLAGSLTLLSSAWDGLMLKFRNSEGYLKKTVDYFRAMVDYASELIGGTDAKIEEGISNKVESTTRVLGQVTKELEAKYKADKKVLELAKEMAKDKGINEAQAIGVIASNKAREAASKSMLESLKEELAIEQELLNTAELKIQSAKELSEQGRTPSQKRLNEMEKERKIRQGNVDAINAAIKATQEYKKELKDFPLKTPDKVDDEGSKADDRARKMAEEADERARKSKLNELQLLEEKYQQELVLLNQFGIDTTNLTDEYRQKAYNINKKWDDQEKAREAERVRLEKERKRKEYEDQLRELQHHLDMTISTLDSESIDSRNAFQKFFGIGDQSIIDKQNEAQIQILQAEIEFARKLLENDQLTADERYRIQKDLTDNINGLAKLEGKIEDDKVKARKDSTKKMFTDMMSMYAEYETGYKMMASAEALMSTYEGAQKSYTSLAGIPVVGPALGIAAAGVATAAGIKRVKDIWAVKKETAGNVSASSAQAVAPPPIAQVRNVMGQEDIQLQKEINSDISPVVRVIDIEKGLNRSSTRISEASY